MVFTKFLHLAKIFLLKIRVSHPREKDFREISVRFCFIFFAKRFLRWKPRKPFLAELWVPNKEYGIEGRYN